MKNSIIMPTKYEKIFMIETRKSGLIKHTDMNNDFNKFDEWEDNLYSKYYQTKQNLFQILLLYDDLIIPAFDPTYEYNKLNDLGCFSIYSFDEFYRYDPTHEEGHLEYAEYLKPAIMPVITKELKTYFPLRDDRIPFKTIVSDLYDLALGIKKKTIIKMDEIFDLNKFLFGLRHERHYPKLKKMNAPSNLIENRFFMEISQLIVSNYTQLCWELDISSQKDAYIVNCDYQLSKMGCNGNTKNINTYLDSYKILKCECSKIIGNLPKMNTLYDVFNLKEKRKNDINNLRNVLYQLEYTLKNEGREQTIINAANDVRKAAASLAKRNELNAVGKWTTLFSIPVGIAELLCGLPPVGLVLSGIGTGVCLADEFLKSKNSWCEIVR